MKTLAISLGLLLYAQPTLIPAALTVLVALVAGLLTLLEAVTTTPLGLAVAVGVALARVLHRAVTPRQVAAHA